MLSLTACTFATLYVAAKRRIIRAAFLCRIRAECDKRRVSLGLKD